MAVILGVLVAAAYGSGDFLGGRASRDSPTVGVLFVAQVTAVVGAVVAALAIGADVAGRDLAFGAAAGMLNAVGLGLLFHGLATGRMGVVAPVTAVVAAVVPITWGLVTGERPSVLTWVGVVLAVGAGALVAREPDLPPEPGHAPVSTRQAITLAVGAGLLFGISFVCFAETGEDSGYWPVLTARVAAVVVVGIAVTVLLRRGRTALVPRGTPLRLAVGAGVLDVVATTGLVTAVREGLVVVVAPLAALAPAYTVVWAWALLHEPVTRHQVAGLGLALAGLACIAAG